MNFYVLILLLFPSTCYGKEHYSSPLPGVLPTTNWQKKIETPIEASCPDLHDIEPCECSTSLISGLFMDCSNVQDEEQLREIFSAFFPTTEFNVFIMHGNHGLKVLEDGIFGNVSFRFFDIGICDLQIVETDAFTPSLSTVRYIWIQVCKLEIFPFERLTEFTSLEFLSLPDNKIHTLPPLSSSSLQNFDLNGNLISYLTHDVFALLPVIGEINLGWNQLTEIPKGTFTGLPKLAQINLYRNNISYLQSFTFEVVSSDVYLTALDLNFNNIEYVEVDAFKGVAENVTISMTNNALTRLPEEQWRPVLEKNITVNLAGNDLACGCDVAWIVRDPQLLAMVSDARCADGTLLMDLIPADFDICG